LLGVSKKVGGRRKAKTGRKSRTRPRLRSETIKTKKSICRVRRYISPILHFHNHKIEGESEEEVDDLSQIRFLYMGNHRVDYATMKALFYCARKCDIDMLKLIFCYFKYN
jgi:hypothetical protein